MNRSRKKQKIYFEMVRAKAIAGGAEVMADGSLVLVQAKPGPHPAPEIKELSRVPSHIH